MLLRWWPFVLTSIKQHLRSCTSFNYILTTVEPKSINWVWTIILWMSCLACIYHFISQTKSGVWRMSYYITKCASSVFTGKTTSSVYFFSFKILSFRFCKYLKGNHNLTQTIAVVIVNSLLLTSCVGII